MFRTITRLLFGGEEEMPQEVKSGELVEEGWLVVGHHQAESLDGEPTESEMVNSTLHEVTAANMETDRSVLDEDATVQSSSSAASRAISSSLSQPKLLTEATQLTCTQKAKALAERHHASRNAILRQNRVRQGVQHHTFHLQQPGHRNVSH